MLRESEDAPLYPHCTPGAKWPFPTPENSGDRSRPNSPDHLHSGGSRIWGMDSEDRLLEIPRLSHSYGAALWVLCFLLPLYNQALPS